MSPKISRRLLLRRGLAVGGLVAGIGAVEAGKQAFDLLEQRGTWNEASKPNSEFLARHAPDLERLTLGASFAPEQWPRRREGQEEAMRALDMAVRDLGMRQLRIGLRWDRSVNQRGEVDLRYYRAMLDYCLSNEVEVCLNVGPIKTFRWPEEHVPTEVLKSLEWVPPPEGTVARHGSLAGSALDYLDRLLEALQRDYGEALSRVRTVQVENEPFYPLGVHRWRLSAAYLEEVALRVDQAFPEAEIMLTSAGRLDLHSVRDVLTRLLRRDARFAGRLASGFDFHYKTPLRDATPVVRHFDQVAYARPFTPTTEGNIHDARVLGYRIEVTEGQMEPYGHLKDPGNSARDLRYLILRCLDKVLDPKQPALIRVWGLEELAKKLLRGEANDEHRQMVEIIHNVNSSQGGGDPGVRAQG